MKTFKKHLKDSLKKEEFKVLYDEELELQRISYELHSFREKKGLSQERIAKKAHLTQQQVSKVENGINCNILTYLKACHAVGLKLELKAI